MARADFELYKQRAEFNAKAANLDLKTIEVGLSAADCSARFYRKLQDFLSNKLQATFEGFGEYPCRFSMIVAESPIRKQGSLFIKEFTVRLKKVIHDQSSKEREFQKYLDALKETQPEKCNFPGCVQSKIISAHAIQEAALAQLARNGKVYAVTSRRTGFIRKRLSSGNEWNLPGLLEIKHASTFFGFCEAHDKGLFQPVEDSTLLPTDKQAFLIHYRAIASELDLVESFRGLGARSLSRLGSSFFPDEEIRKLDEGTDVAINEFRRLKGEMDKRLLGEVFDDMRFWGVRFKGSASLVCTGLVGFDSDFIGNPIPAFGDYRVNDTSFTVVPIRAGQPELGFVAIFAWLNSPGSKVLPDIFRSFGKVRGETFGSILLQFSFLNIESNLFLSPAWDNVRYFAHICKSC